MKLTLLLIAVAFSCMLALAQKEPVVQHTGTLSMWLTKSETSASITVDGETTSAYCNSTDTSIDCTNTAGGYQVTFDDGNRTPFSVKSLMYDFSKCDSIAVCSPLSHLAQSVKPNSPVKFQYHWEVSKRDPIVGSTLLYCVDFTVTDKHGKEKPQKACYMVAFVWTPQGKALFPGKDGLLAPLKESNPYHGVSP
jgi:hypothetical protein